MGSYNKTCGFTNLPIEEGDAVRFYILLPHSSNAYYQKNAPLSSHVLNGNGFCYSTDIFTPICFGIPGIYDGYGGVTEILDSPENEVLTNFLREEYDIQNLNKIEEIFNLFQEHELKTVSCVMVLESAYQHIIEVMEKAKEKDASPYTFSSKIIQDELFEFLTSFYQNPDAARYGLVAPSNFHAFPDNIQMFFRKIQLHTLFLQAKLLSQQVVSRPILKKVVEHSLIESFMMEQRKFWSPQSGDGGQDENYHLYRKMAEFTLAHLDKKKQAIIDDSELTEEEVKDLDQYY